MENNKKFVYFISNGNFVKIGITNNPEKRLNSLQSANSSKLFLLYYMEGNERIEKVLHNIFEQYRVRGEWFQLTDVLKQFILMLKDYGFTFTDPNKVPVNNFKDNNEVVVDKRLKNLVCDLIKEYEDYYGVEGKAVSLNMVVKKVAEIEGMDYDDVENLIKQLKRKGIIYEPQKGRIECA